MKNELLQVPELVGIEPSKADKIKKAFEPMVNMLSEFEYAYNELMSVPESEITLELTEKYKRLRLDIGKIRIETGKTKDKQKEYIKLEDKAIMGVHNILVWAVKEKEDNLKSREDFFKIKEEKRLSKLQSDRVELLSEFVEDANERDLSKFEEDEFQALLTIKKQQHEDKLEAEKQAEIERLNKIKAEAEERQRIREENEKLKKQAEIERKKAELDAKKRAEIERVRLEKEAKEKKDRERKEKELREEKEKFEREERLKREKLERELQEKRDAEIKAEKEREALIQLELSKGDEDKLNDLINDLKSLKTKYEFKSSKNKKMYSDVRLLIDKVINHIIN